MTQEQRENDMVKKCEYTYSICKSNLYYATFFDKMLMFYLKNIWVHGTMTFLRLEIISVHATLCSSLSYHFHSSLTFSECVTPSKYKYLYTVKSVFQNVLCNIQQQYSILH